MDRLKEMAGTTRCHFETSYGKCKKQYHRDPNIRCRFKHLLNTNDLLEESLKETSHNNPNNDLPITHDQNITQDKNLTNDRNPNNEKNDELTPPHKKNLPMTKQCEK